MWGQRSPRPGRVGPSAWLMVRFADLRPRRIRLEIAFPGTRSEVSDHEKLPSWFGRYADTVVQLRTCPHDRFSSCSPCAPGRSASGTVGSAPAVSRDSGADLFRSAWRDKACCPSALSRECGCIPRKSMRSSEVKSMPLVARTQYCPRVGWFGHDQADRRGERQVCIWRVEACRDGGREAPRVRRGVEDVGHGLSQRVVQIHRRETQNFFHGAHEVDGVVLR